MELPNPRHPFLALPDLSLGQLISPVCWEPLSEYEGAAAREG